MHFSAFWSFLFIWYLAFCIGIQHLVRWWESGRQKLVDGHAGGWMGGNLLVHEIPRESAHGGRCICLRKKITQGHIRNPVCISILK